MATVTITNTLRGTIDAQDKSVSNTYTQEVATGAESSVQVGAAWEAVAAISGTSPSGSPVLIVLINEGAEDALYRIFDGTNYYRMNLPASSSVTLQLAYDETFGGAEGTIKTLALYSANGTRIRIGMFS